MIRCAGKRLARRAHAFAAGLSADNRPRFSPLLLRPFTAVLAVWAAANASRAAEEEVWTRLARFEFNAVAEELGKKRGPPDRELRLAHAVALLNRQPRTSGAIDAAAKQLANLAAENAADDPGRWARYLSARIAQLHRSPANPAEAAQVYRSLISEQASHPAAQRGLMKLAVLLIYETTVEPDRARGFSDAEALLVHATDARAMAELRLLLGRAAAFFRMPAAICIGHLRAAVGAEVANPFLRAAALFALGEYAREAGERELALRSYRQFIVENERDARAYLVREHIAALEKAMAAR